MSILDLLKSKTIWGTVIAVLGALSSPDVLALLPQKVAAILVAIGTILGAVGLRTAVAKGPTA